MHPDKSEFCPSHVIEYLGFVINSTDMTVRFTVEKKRNIRDFCLKVVSAQYPTIREVAQLLGNLVQTLQELKWAFLHYRSLERDKINYLKESRGNFEKRMSLSNAAIHDI